MDPFTIAMTVGGLASKIIPGLLGQNQEDWKKNALINVLNTLNQYGGLGGLKMQQAGDYGQASAMGLDQRGTQFLWGNDQQPGFMDILSGRLNESGQNIHPYLFNNYQGIDTPLSDILNQQTGTAGINNPLFQSLYNYNGPLGTQGQTQTSSFLTDRLKELGMGLGSSDMLQNVGGELLAQRGRSNFGNVAQDRGMDVLNQYGRSPESQGGFGVASGILGSGGYTPSLQNMYNFGMQSMGNSMGTGGLTPTGAQGEIAALNQLQTGGENPLTQYLQGRGADITSKDPLLSMGQVMSFATENAGQQAKDAAQAAYTRALNRGGGPGATVANGMQNQAMADFADQISESKSKALRDAMMQQQGLQLNQFQQGSQMAQAGGNLANQRLGTAGGLLSNLEDVASRRYGIGGNLMTGAESTAANRLNTGADFYSQLLGAQNQASSIFGGLGNQAQQNEIARMGMGGNLQNIYDQNRLAGLNQLGSLNNAENNFYLGAGGLANQLQGTQGNIYNQAFGNQLGAGQLGMNQMSSYYDALNKLYGNQLNMNNQGMTMQNSALDYLSKLASTWGGITQQAIGGFPGIFGNYQPRNPLGEAIGSGIGFGAGAIGGMAGGGSGSGGGNPDVGFGG